MVDVSVVIATRNRAQKLKQAIDSVLAQTVRVREVIVVDDGSTDDTHAQLACYGDAIRVLLQANAGPSAARNRAIESAQSEWIAFLDDDDVWLPAKIERQMEVIAQNSGLGLVYCSDYAVDEQLQILYPRHANSRNRGDAFEILIVKNFIFTSCVIARRDLILRVGGMNPAYRFAEDWDLWIKIVATHPVDFAPEPLVYYRQSPSGCLTQDTPIAERIADVAKILRSALQVRPLPGHIRRKALHQLEMEWAMSYLSKGVAQTAVLHALKALALGPASLAPYRVIAHALLPE